MEKGIELKEANIVNKTEASTTFETIVIFLGVIFSAIGLFFQFRFVDIAETLYKPESANELYVAQLAAVLLGLSLFVIGLVLIFVIIFKLKYLKNK